MRGRGRGPGLSRADHWLPLLHEIADRADEVALRGFRSDSLRVEEKADGSPVSEVDRAIEEMARSLVRERHPGLGVLGEEQGGDAGDAGSSGARLIIDPIDGTRNFVRGIPVFGTLLAIEAEGEVVAGVATAPALGARWHAARGSGAFLGTRRLRVSGIRELRQAMLLHGNLGPGEGGPPRGLMRLMRGVDRTRGFGDFYQHMLVAQGAGEIAIDPVVNPWDVAALQVIVEEAGGRATGLDGERSIYAGTFVSSNGLLHEEALALLTEDG